MYTKHNFVHFYGSVGKCTAYLRFMSSRQWTIESYFISSCQRSTMTSRARLQRSHADLEQFGSLVPLISLLSLSDKLSSQKMKMILQRRYDLSGLEWLSSADCGQRHEVWVCACSLVRLTSKLEILTYLYSESVSLTGQWLQWWSREQENKYHYWRANIWLKWGEWHCSAPSTVRVSKTTTYCNVHMELSTFVFSCQPTLAKAIIPLHNLHIPNKQPARLLKSVHVNIHVRCKTMCFLS